MSFGSPGGGTNFAKPIPPERGSFPLDHDNECKMHMASYLTCLKKAKGVNVDDCRMLSKAYLQCRMDRYVMSTGDCSCGANMEEADGKRAEERARRTTAEHKMKRISSLINHILHEQEPNGTRRDEEPWLCESDDNERRGSRVGAGAGARHKEVQRTGRQWEMSRDQDTCSVYHLVA